MLCVNAKKKKKRAIMLFFVNISLSNKIKYFLYHHKIKKNRKHLSPVTYYLLWIYSRSPLGSNIPARHVHNGGLLR